MASIFRKNMVRGILYACLATGILAFGSRAAFAEPAALYPEKQFVLDWLSQPQQFEKFGKISNAIWSYAELGLQEYRSSKLVADTLEEAGFKVERGLADMPTCVVGTYGSGKPVIGILAEYDALPMLSQEGRNPEQKPVVAGAPGHGCGHNMQAAAVTAAVISIKEAMVKYGIKGTIKFFGSPAEETLISRPYMVRAGLFKDVDAVIDNHADADFYSAFGVRGTGMFSTVFSFKGKTAHSGAMPWEGRSALDAVELMNVATNLLREHLFYTYRMHYVITEGGEAPNVVPDKASVWYFVRDSDALVEKDYEKVINAAKGAALATGTEVAKIRVLTAIHQRYQNKAAAELFQSNIELVGMPTWTEEEHAFAKALQKTLAKKEQGFPTKVRELDKPPVTFVGGGSSDVGEVSLIAPLATIWFPGQVPGVINHHWSTTASNYGSAAWKGLNAGAKAMAASAIDLMTKPDHLKKLKDEFEETSKNNPYHSYLPADAKPPLDMYDELMGKYRPAMEKHYLNPK
jgi:aminobenzoyl-glutamate utilization protein B